MALTGKPKRGVILPSQGVLMPFVQLVVTFALAFMAWQLYDLWRDAKYRQVKAEVAIAFDDVHREERCPVHARQVYKRVVALRLRPCVVGNLPSITEGVVAYALQRFEQEKIARALPTGPQGRLFYEPTENFLHVVRYLAAAAARS